MQKLKVRWFEHGFAHSCQEFWRRALGCANGASVLHDASAKGCGGLGYPSELLREKNTFGIYFTTVVSDPAALLLPVCCTQVSKLLQA